MCVYIMYMHIATFHSQPSKFSFSVQVIGLMCIKSRVENQKGLCAYIIYMHIAPFQPSKCSFAFFCNMYFNSQNLHHYYRSLGGWTYAFLSYYLVDFTSMIDRPATQMIEDLVDPICKSVQEYNCVLKMSV